MKICLIITDFETHYSSSFQHTARVKYNVDFNTSNVDSLNNKLIDLKHNVENKIFKDVHVGFEISLEHVIHIQELLKKILNHYVELFGRLPINRKIYTINQKLRDAETPSIKDIAKEVLDEILTPKTEKLTKPEILKIAAEAKSKERLMKTIQKKNANNS